eukprot:PhM_4_TR10429/c0_g1_i1/m.58998/K08292/EEF2K; elongation factor 2 kinase
MKKATPSSSKSTSPAISPKRKPSVPSHFVSTKPPTMTTTTSSATARKQPPPAPTTTANEKELRRLYREMKLPYVSRPVCAFDERVVFHPTTSNLTIGSREMSCHQKGGGQERTCSNLSRVFEEANAKDSSWVRIEVDWCELMELPATTAATTNAEEDVPLLETHRIVVAVSPYPIGTGAFRVVHYLHVKRADGTQEMFVCKLFRSPHVTSQEALRGSVTDVRIQAEAARFASLYNQLNPPKEVHFLPAAMIRYIGTSSSSSSSTKNNDNGYNVLELLTTQLCASVEPLVVGQYVKWSSNMSFVSNDKRLTPLAFSHFTYVVSNGMCMVCDIQGVETSFGYVFTDPQIHGTASRWGSGDLGREGVRLFFASHECNDLCRQYGLPPSNAVFDDWRDDLDLDEAQTADVLTPTIVQRPSLGASSRGSFTGGLLAPTFPSATSNFNLGVSNNNDHSARSVERTTTFRLLKESVYSVLRNYDVSRNRTHIRPDPTDAVDNRAAKAIDEREHQKELETLQKQQQQGVSANEKLQGVGKMCASSSSSSSSSTTTPSSATTEERNGEEIELMASIPGVVSRHALHLWGVNRDAHVSFSLTRDHSTNNMFVVQTMVPPFLNDERNGGAYPRKLVVDSHGDLDEHAFQLSKISPSMWLFVRRTFQKVHPVCTFFTTTAASDGASGGGKFVRLDTPGINLHDKLSPPATMDNNSSTTGNREVIYAHSANLTHTAAMPQDIALVCYNPVEVPYNPRVVWLERKQEPDQSTSYVETGSFDSQCLEHVYKNEDYSLHPAGVCFVHAAPTHEKMLAVSTTLGGVVLFPHDAPLQHIRLLDCEAYCDKEDSSNLPHQPRRAVRTCVSHVCVGGLYYCSGAQRLLVIVDVMYEGCITPDRLVKTCPLALVHRSSHKQTKLKNYNRCFDEWNLSADKPAMISGDPTQCVAVIATDSGAMSVWCTARAMPLYLLPSPVGSHSVRQLTLTPNYILSFMENYDLLVWKFYGSSEVVDGCTRASEIVVRVYADDEIVGMAPVKENEGEDGINDSVMLSMSDGRLEIVNIQDWVSMTKLKSMESRLDALE